MNMLSDDYADEVEGISKMSTSLVTRDGVLRRHRQSAAIECLALARDIARRIDARYKELIKPLSEKIEPYTHERKAYQAVLDNAETAMKEALLTELADEGMLPEESEHGVRMSIIAKPKLRITDASKVPDAFLLPREQCIDVAALTAHLKKERDVIRACVAAKTDQPSPLATRFGADLVDEFVLSTRLPEVMA